MTGKLICKGNTEATSTYVGQVTIFLTALLHVPETDNRRCPANKIETTHTVRPANTSSQTIHTDSLVDTTVRE